VYLVLHYDAETGELLRNGKVNGSEAQSLGAAKLLGLLDSYSVSVERGRDGESVVADGPASGNPALEEARMLLAAQRKPRGITWCLSNLGGTAPVIARLVQLGLLVDERKPLSPLTPAGLEVLRSIRSLLDPLVEERAVAQFNLVGALLDTGKLWRNVYPGRDRAGQQALAARLAAVTAVTTTSGGDRARVLGRLRSESRAA
jgi:hypothetical protein